MVLQVCVWDAAQREPLIHKYEHHKEFVTGIDWSIFRRESHTKIDTHFSSCGSARSSFCLGALSYLLLGCALFSSCLESLSLFSLSEYSLFFFCSSALSVFAFGRFLFFLLFVLVFGTKTSRSCLLPSSYRSFLNIYDFKTR